MKTEEFENLILGAGAAGLMCALTAAERGLPVAVIDSNRMVGRKLRITGKGRCNITNSCDVNEFMKNVTVNSRFLYSSINRLTPAATMSFFEERGLKLKTERGNRVFPESDNANDVAELLYRKCIRNGARFIRDRISSVSKDGDVFLLKGSSSVYRAEKLVICTGGKSYPLTGSDGTGYSFAETFGHTVVSPVPSLVPLESSSDYCAQMQGFSLKNVRLDLYENDKKTYTELGEMLFTHFGVSGPLVLSASAHIKKFPDAVYRIEIDLKPGLDEKKLDARILRDFEKYSNREFRNSLDDLAGKSMIPVLVSLSGIPPETKVNTVTREQRKKLVALFKAFPVPVSGFRPIDEAIITSGGVSVNEVNPRTMESKLESNLYFAGEILDVDAYTGGFNLQIAWSTGYTAGMSL